MREQSGSGREGPRVVGRYAIYDRIAAGGMATVHLGRLLGEGGFARTVAIKRLHTIYARDPQFVAMFLDEAHMASRIAHHNVAATLDVVADDGELLLVLEYVPGESLSRLMMAVRERGLVVPQRVAVAIMAGVLHGLHAAHEAVDESGAPLHIVHRDVSPHNILVGADGVARVLDFGVAKAANRLSETREGDRKGKAAYMAPEQKMGGKVTLRSDIYAAGLVLWELVTGERFNQHPTPSANMKATRALAPSEHRFQNLSATLDNATFEKLRSLDHIAMRALHPDPEHRYATAREMALALEQSTALATSTEVSEWVHLLAGEALRDRRELVHDIESRSTVHKPSARAVVRSFMPPAIDADTKRDDSRARVQPPPRRMPPVVSAMLGGGIVGMITVLAVALLLRTRPPPPASVPVPASVPASVPVPTSVTTTAPTETIDASPLPEASPSPTSPRPPRAVATTPPRAARPEPSNEFSDWESRK